MGVIFTTVVAIIRCRPIKRKRVYNVIVWLFMIVCLWFNLSSPGTAKRMSALESLNEKIPLFEVVELAATWGIENVEKWMRFKEIACIVILLPILAKIADSIRNEYRFKFKWPIIVVVISVAWTSVMQCPVLYAARQFGAGRVEDIIYYNFIILLFINAIYIIGWIQQFLKEDTKIKMQHISRAYVLALLVLLIPTYIIGKEESWAYEAWYEMYIGEAQQYEEEYKERELILCNSKGEHVELPAYSVRPSILYFADILEDPKDWRNIEVSNYYELESVVRVKRE